MSIDFKLKDFAYPLNILRLRDFLERSQWFPPDRIRVYRRHMLRKVIRHSYRYVPYYRELFDRLGLVPEDIKDVNDLGRMPTLSRETVHRCGRDLLADNAWRFRPMPVKTSGTTGRPLTFYLDKPANVLEFSYYWRHWSWAGYRLGQRFAELGSHYFVSRPGMSGLVAHAQPQFGRLMLNSNRISPDDVGEFARAIRRFRPRYLKGLPSALYFLALFIKERGVSDIHFRAVFSTGETVTPQYRDLIEGTFHCRVLDSYGHMERTVAISQCPAGGYHVNWEYGLLELAEARRKNDPRTGGMVIGTSLHRFAMPFIRYEVGDFVETFPEGRTCPCGRTLPLVKAVHGRQEDVIVTPDGRCISTVYLALSFVPGIRFGQFVQERKGRLLVNIVRGRDYRPESEHLLRTYVARFVGRGMKVDVRYIGMDEVARGPSGKVRTVISHVPPAGV